MRTLLEYFEGRTEGMLDLLRELVEHESPSSEKQAVDRLTAFVEAKARAIGASTSVIAQQEWGDHLSASWGSGEKELLLLCHLDTVWPLGTLKERPWKVEDGRVFGPGCYDNKSSAAIILSVMEGIQDLGLELKHRVRVLFNSDEEMGSRSSRSIIEEAARSAAAVLCVESGPSDGSLRVWRKGTGRYTVTALGRSVHSGANHAQGVNAIEELARQIVILQEMTDYASGNTINVGRVEGGTRPNVVPDRASALVDLRVMTMDEAERMDALIRGLEPVMPRARLIIEGGINRPPMEESAATMDPFRKAQTLAEKLGISLSASGSGGASDANFTSALGVPTLDGLGGIGDGAHSPEEYVVASSLAERTALMAALITEW